MEIAISSQNFETNQLAVELVKNIERSEDELDLVNATLYHEFPMFKEIDMGLEYPSFLLVSPVHGIVVIQLDDRGTRTLTDEILDEIYEDTEQIYSFIYSKMVKIPSLRKKRSRSKLLFDIHTIIYLPNYEGEIEKSEDEEVYWVTSFTGLKATLNKIKTDKLSDDVISEIYSVIDGTRAIPKPNKRNIKEDQKSTKGGILEELEYEIATFDRKQKLAVLTQIDGPQRIRGMAGSGKTIVLAMKAALIHLRNPEAKILYTFYTKSLYDHIRHLITRFYRMHQDHDPDWDKVVVRHAWGGQNLPGVYYEACIENNVEPLKLAIAKQRGAINNMNAFEYACFDLLKQTNGKLRKGYDYVLIDEGQDFPPSFYWLCRKIVKNDCLVWAYDELQNILNIEMQETTKLFKNEFGDEGIDLEELQKKTS